MAKVPSKKKKITAKDNNKKLPTIDFFRKCFQPRDMSSTKRCIAVAQRTSTWGRFIKKTVLSIWCLRRNRSKQEIALRESTCHLLMYIN